jgi:Scaffold protein Nfu/NifU N terminal
MGQPITVVEKPSPLPNVVRFEANRSLTGMSHERYPSRDAATGTRPPDELARRLFDTNKVDGVHVYSNVITVDLAKGCRSEGLREIVENLFRYYREGVTPPAV